jgi:hypothetical protein
MKILIILLEMACFVSCGCQIKPILPTSRPVVTVAGAIRRQFGCRLSTDVSSIKVVIGRPTKLKLILNNVDEPDAGIAENGGEWLYDADLTALADDAMPIERFVYDRWPNYISYLYADLSPGKQLETDIQLDRLFRFYKTGEFKVKFELAVCDSGRSTHLVSCVVNLVVSEPPDQK